MHNTTAMMYVFALRGICGNRVCVYMHIYIYACGYHIMYIGMCAYALMYINARATSNVGSYHIIPCSSYIGGADIPPLIDTFIQTSDPLILLQFLHCDVCVYVPMMRVISKPPLPCCWFYRSNANLSTCLFMLHPSHVGRIRYAWTWIFMRSYTVHTYVNVLWRLSIVRNSSQHIEKLRVKHMLSTIRCCVRFDNE